jgi:two-component system, LytTR family, sensor kinase
MEPDKNIHRLIKIAVYTSPLIGILAITPIFIHRAVSIYVFPRAVLIITLATFSVWCLNILLFYSSENIKSLKNSTARILRYVISYAISTVLIIFAARMLRLGLYSQTFVPDVTISHFPYASSILGLSINTVILIIQDLIVLREKQAGIEIENANLKLKNTEALIEQLKQQIHPHFLFNSLNTLKSLINKSPEAAEDYLVKLSDFLRVSMTGKENVVSIDNEMKLCLDYLEMQKIRYGSALKYSIDISDEQSKSGFIPAFSLQLLTENAIKHNVLTAESPLHIDICYESGRIVVRNNFRKKATSESSPGLGLINLAERYRILSGDEILIKNSDNMFSVSIKILNYENSNYRR